MVAIFPLPAPRVLTCTPPSFPSFKGDYSPKLHDAGYSPRDLHGLRVSDDSFWKVSGQDRGEKVHSSGVSPDSGVSHSLRLLTLLHLSFSVRCRLRPRQDPLPSGWSVLFVKVCSQGKEGRGNWPSRVYG